MLSAWLLFTLIGPLGADTPADLENAREVVRQAMVHNRQMGSFGVQFRYTLTDNGRITSQDGAAFFSRRGFRVAYEGLDYYGSARYVWVHHRDVDRVFIYDAAPGGWWDIERLFLYDWSQAEVKEMSADEAWYRVSLRLNEPQASQIGPQGGLYQADLWIGAADGHLQRAILYGQDGRLHSYEIKAYDPRARVPRHVVEFQPRRYPDAELLPFTAAPYFDAEESY